MNPRYAPGGDIYESIKAKYGRSAADRVYAAAKSQDPGAIARVLGEVRNGPELNESTWSIFTDQIIKDPLAAPLDSANSQIGKAIANVFKNPWVLFAIGLWLFLSLGGFDWIRRQVSR